MSARLDRLLAGARSLGDLREDLRAVAARARGAGHTSPLSVATDTSAWALTLLRASIGLRRAFGTSLGTRAALRLAFHIDVWTDDIGKGLRLPHPFNIVIGGGATIGEQCTLMHNTTVQHGRGTRVGDGAVLGVGAVVLAGRSVGDGALCGANAVVAHDVAPRSTVAGVPARPITRADGASEVADARRPS